MYKELMKCLTCGRLLSKGYTINCQNCTDNGSPYTKFKTADTGDGNCDS